MTTQTLSHPNPAEATHAGAGAGAKAAEAGVRKTDIRAATVNALLDANTPFVIWGPPGIGKSRQIEAVAAARGWHCEVILGSIREPQDLTGFPAVADDGTFTLLAPNYVRRITEAITAAAEADAAGYGAILFLDEVSNCSPPQQAAMLRILTDRVVGETPLPASCRIVLAANPTDQATDGWDLAAPMANRMLHLTWDSPDPADWIAGLLANWGQPDPEAGADLDRVIEARGLVAGFISARPNLLHDLPGNEAQASGAWPSPRSWADMVISGLAVAATITHPELRAAVERDIVTGAVGEATGLEFLMWRRDQDLVDPALVLEFPDDFIAPDRADRLHATLAAVASLAIGRGDIDSWSCAWVVLGHAAQVGHAEVAAVAARALVINRPDEAPLPPQIAAFATMLRAAGLLPEVQQ